MMTPEDKKMIDGLFARLDEAAKAMPPADVDPDANRVIREAVAARPLAPYLLAQNAVVLDQALREAQAKIAELENSLAAARSGSAPIQASGFAGPWVRPSSAPTAPQGGPWGGAPQPAPAPAPQSGGFMRTALMTAAGVAGGALLFSGISSMFGGGAAHAATPTPSAAPAADPTASSVFDNADSGGSGDSWDSGFDL